jgi:NAD(P)-dependent dehydrogenase (short-subunit alcohol dehydrogenase family)
LVSGFGFVGAVAVVTGGAGGIGSALGRALAAQGCPVALVDLDLAAAEAAASSIPGAVGFAADVGDESAVERMIAQVQERLGPIDVYCSNAGVATPGGVGDAAAWEVSWRVHAMAHVHAARALLPGMVGRGRGAFVVTASAAGLLLMMQSAPYTVTKHAAVAFSEWLAVVYGGRGVQIHCLCPQGVKTPMIVGDPAGGHEVEASGELLEPDAVATCVVEAIRSGEFLVLPHPQVHEFERMKVDDRDRWLRGMRRLLARVENGAE